MSQSVSRAISCPVSPHISLSSPPAAQYITLAHTIQCITVGTVQYAQEPVQRCPAKRNAMLNNQRVLSKARCGTAQHSTAQHAAAQHSTVHAWPDSADPLQQFHRRHALHCCCDRNQKHRRPPVTRTAMHHDVALLERFFDARERCLAATPAHNTIPNARHDKIHYDMVEALQYCVRLAQARSRLGPLGSKPAQHSKLHGTATKTRREKQKHMLARS